MNELLAQFVAEARDLLEEAGEVLLVLERTPDDQESINCLFRAVHTLKGSSGLFDVTPLTRVLHAAEDIFQSVREHRLSVTPELVDLALQVLDQVGHWIGQLDQDEALEPDAAPVAARLAAELRSRFGQMDAPLPGVPMTAATPPAATGLPPDLRRWFAPDALQAAAACDGEISLVSYLPEPGCFFRGEDPLHLALQIPQLIALEAPVQAPWQALCDLDPFVCNLGFQALSAAGRGELETLFRYVPDQMTITTMPAASLGGGVAYTVPPNGLPDIVAAVLGEQIALLDTVAPDDAFAGRAGAAATVAANALAFDNRTEDAAAVAAAGALALAERSPDALRAAIAAVLDMATAKADQPELALAPVLTDRPAAPEQAERTAPRILRVDQEKVDALMNLVGELVVAKNSLPFLARRAEQHFGLRELGREIKDQYGVIDRIAQELQSAVMAVRMMPVGQVFQRLPRLVRDLSRKLGKQVDLVIEGEETEADKNVIESLFDPLLHMVRNSLDHGVETPAERAALGKPVTAVVKLTARHDGDQVVIEVVDDGRGIDPDAIKRKAHERGLIDDARLASISDDDATMLVFAAGFSTAATVTDVSGRGVGMDVVRNAVEKAGGRIAMTSVKGQGTTVRLRLPLSMAVTRVMTVVLGDRLFGIPMNLIHQTVKIPRQDVVRIKDNEAFVLREQVVPLVHLSRLLDLADVPPPGDEVAVLVVRVGGQTVGLGISAFGEGMEVILKPLEGMLGHIAGFSGTALLGDGRVLLVLDLKELIQ